jgi:triacylglycerol esterase/lipase EstA (alpha/beta hydrolase family)
MGNRSLRRGLAAAIACAAALALAAPAFAQGPEGASPAGANDFSCDPTKAHPRPVVLVHGLSARMGENWGYVSPRLAAAGYCVFALTYGQDPRNAALPYSPGGLLAMQESSKELKAFVNRVRKATGARKVDLVGHSEGTVMPRWYLERRGGRKRVKRFVALTPLWRGTQLAALDLLRDSAAGFGLAQPLIDLVSGFCASCPQFLRGSDYMNELNADGERIKGIKHTNIVTRYDELVQPYTSGIMGDGGHNIVLQEVCPANVSEHALVAFDPAVMQMILNALAPKHTQPIPC